MCGLYLVWGSLWWYLRVAGWFLLGGPGSVCSGVCGPSPDRYFVL
jgi:hypothetical protein